MYPEPPKDMWYQVPAEKPKPQESPQPIFPWERTGYGRPKPTRVFAEDLALPPPPEVIERPPIMSPEEEKKQAPFTGDGRNASEDADTQPFSPQPNAWDNVESIERYVRAVMSSQTRRSSKQQRRPDDLFLDLDRKESLILTDFPTADDRPSLPVTPAPIRRPTFWGEERDEGGELRTAEGVPDQADWVSPHCGFSARAPLSVTVPIATRCVRFIRRMR